MQKAKHFRKHAFFLVVGRGVMQIQLHENAKWQKMKLDSILLLDKLWQEHDWIGNMKKNSDIIVNTSNTLSVYKYMTIFQSTCCRCILHCNIDYRKNYLDISQHENYFGLCHVMLNESFLLPFRVSCFSLGRYLLRASRSRKVATKRKTTDSEM